MAVIGLWHGAGWGFILWGVMHGVYLVAYRAYQSVQAKHFPSLADSRWNRLAWRAFTLLAVAAAWIPFRASTIHQALIMLNSMFLKINISHLALSYSVNFYLVTFLIALLCLVEPYLGRPVTWLDRLSAKYQAALVTNMFLVRPLIYAFGLLMFVLFDDRDTQFIYFQF